MDAFLAIEKVLNFHHLTTRQPLRVAQLRFRAFQNGTPVSQQNIQEIMHIWPEAYKMYALKGQQVIEALDLPLRAEERKARFQFLWAEKENLVDKKEVLVSTNTLKREGKREALKPILMGKPRPQLSLSDSKIPLNLLDRIRAKESRLKQQRSPMAIKSARDAFLRSQVPKLLRVLADLNRHQTHCSLDMDTVMDVLRTNLFKLSDEEITRTLEMVSEMHPSFCSIIKVGNSERLSLRASVDVC